MQRNTIFTMKNAAYKAFKYDVFLIKNRP